MNTKDFETRLIPRFYKQLESDGFSKTIMDANRWILTHFCKYCRMHSIVEIDMSVIARFLLEQYDIEIDNIKGSTQTIIRKPLLSIWEFGTIGKYHKCHQVVKDDTPDVYRGLSDEFESHVRTLSLNPKTTKDKIRVARRFFLYLYQSGVSNIADLSKANVYKYFDRLGKYARSTEWMKKIQLRCLINWLHEKSYISFSGQQLLPRINQKGKYVIPSFYNDDDIRKILNIVKTETKAGKRDYLILSLAVHYGMRISDIIRLKQSDIDWAGGVIRIAQQKTGKPLVLPLIDEVKFPLLDYLKNARYPLDDDHILITTCAPYTPYKENTFQRMVTKYMKIGNISFEGKHHGPHSLRHSMASSMLKKNTPISTISGVLGHESILTTESYLKVDTKDFRELSLEVPYVFSAKI